MTLKVQKYAFICIENLKICRLKNKNIISKFWNNKKMSTHNIKSVLKVIFYYINVLNFKK